MSRNVPLCLFTNQASHPTVDSICERVTAASFGARLCMARRDGVVFAMTLGAFILGTLLLLEPEGGGRDKVAPITPGNDHGLARSTTAFHPDQTRLCRIAGQGLYSRKERHFMRRLSFCFAAAAIALQLIPLAVAQQASVTTVPNLIRYGGTLKDADGAPWLPRRWA